MWYPDLVGKINGYPSTQAIYDRRVAENRWKMILQNARGMRRRTGVPDGWSGPERQALLEQVRARAQKDAAKIVKVMKNEGMMDDEDPRGDAAIEAAVEVVIAKDDATNLYAYPVGERIKAMKLIAEFCKRKPAAKVEAKMDAEDFLRGLIRK